MELNVHIKILLSFYDKLFLFIWKMMEKYPHNVKNDSSPHLYQYAYDILAH